MPHQPPAQRAAALLLGLLLGVAGGWLAGLLRAPRPDRSRREGPVPARPGTAGSLR